jgi:protein-S-isoprenylcysteine O-methyltransferase Ste14
VVTNAIVTGCIVVLFFSIVTAIIRLRRKGYNALSGVPPIHALAFVTGKLSMAITIFTMLATALGLRASPEASPALLQWLAVLLLLVGLGFAVPSLFQLGEELRFGLSEAQTSTLKSTGLYRVSRNPLYLGFFLVAIASCLYAPSWTSLFFAVLAIAIHHRVVLAEEKFLSRQFGTTYDDYTRLVPRYL